MFLKRALFLVFIQMAFSAESFQAICKKDFKNVCQRAREGVVKVGKQTNKFFHNNPFVAAGIVGANVAIASIAATVVIFDQRRSSSGSQSSTSNSSSSSSQQRSRCDGTAQTDQPVLAVAVSARPRAFVTGSSARALPAVHQEQVVTDLPVKSTEQLPATSPDSFPVDCESTLPQTDLPQYHTDAPISTRVLPTVEPSHARTASTTESQRMASHQRYETRALANGNLHPVCSPSPISERTSFPPTRAASAAPRRAVRLQPSPAREYSAVDDTTRERRPSSPPARIGDSALGQGVLSLPFGPRLSQQHEYVLPRGADDDDATREETVLRGPSAPRVAFAANPGVGIPGLSLGELWTHQARNGDRSLQQRFFASPARSDRTAAGMSPRTVGVPTPGRPQVGPQSARLGSHFNIVNEVAELRRDVRTILDFLRSSSAHNAPHSDQEGSRQSISSEPSGVTPVNVGEHRGESGLAA